MGLTPIKVGQLNHYIGRILRNDPLLSEISIIGEISNLTFHRSGHIYFSLKDETSRIDCFLSSRIAPDISSPIEEGLEVIASGYISVYERGGRYSLNVLDLEPAGKGQLAVRFEELKQRLQKEGLFDPAHKKPLPEFPLTVAVVTSQTGAAIQDIQKIIRSKNDVVHILIVPVLVQGPGAASDIASAIEEINREHPEVDVIIAGRGGGSMEDLWAFNEEIVARSIYASRIPVISAVGHETDITIADFAADVRAETPTAAADLAVPDTRQLRQMVDYYREEMTRSLMQRLVNGQQRLRSMDPAAFASGIRTRIEYEQLHLDQLQLHMSQQMAHRITEAEHRIELLRQGLQGANPLEILKKGYVAIEDGGHIVRSVQELTAGREVSLRLADGRALAQIIQITEEDGA